MLLHRRLLRGLMMALILLCFSALSAFSVQAQPSAPAVEDSQGLTKKAKKLYKAKKYTEAATGFREAIHLESTNYRAHMGLGRSLEKSTQLEAALTAYREALEVLPNEHRFLLRLGVVHRKLGQLDASAKAYRQFSTVLPNKADAYYGLGLTLEAATDTAGSIQAFEQYLSLEKRPKEQKFIDRAKKKLKKLKALPPAPKPSTSTTKTPKTSTGAPKIASSAAPGVWSPPPAEDPSIPANAYADFDPEQLESTLSSGSLAFRAGDYAAAVTRYQAATTLSPRHLEAHYKLGVSLACTQQFGAAMDAWEHCLKLAPDFKAAQENLIRAQQRLAVDANLDPEILHAGPAPEQHKLMERYLKEGRPLMALRAAKLLLETSPQDARSLHLQALAHLDLNQPTLALDALKIAIKSPKNTEVYHLMGDAHALLQENTQAAYFYTLYLEHQDPTQSSPEHDELRERLRQLASNTPVKDPQERSPKTLSTP